MTERENQLRELCSGQLQHVLHSSDYIRGLIFSVAAAPEIPMPEVWLLWAFDQRGQIASTEQADNLTDLLMGLLQQQLKDMRDNKVSLPRDLAFVENSQTSSPLSLWMTGLLAGHSQLEQVWLQAWEKVAKQSPERLPQMQKDLKFCLGMFSTFADIPLALEQSAEPDRLRVKLPQIYHSLPQALKQYVDLSGTLVDFLPDQFETFTKTDP